MKVSKFFFFLMGLFAVALIVYVLTTPSSQQVQLTGIVTGTDEIVSPLVTGRLQKLLVDEGSEVKKGQLIAEIDPTELKSARDAAAANIQTLQARVEQSSRTLAMNDEQTAAAVAQAAASVTAAKAQLEQAQANLALNEVTYKRDQGLFAKGVIAEQERDTSEDNWKASQANVTALEDQVKASEAQLAVAQANRMQLQVQQADIEASRSQVAQSVAQKDQAQTQLSYSEVYSPIDGIVSVRVARQGEWVQADVEENMIDSIQFNQKLKVRLPSGNEIEGTVFFKGVENDYATQRDVSRTKRDIKTFEIKVAIPNEGRRLFTGMTAYVLLPSTETKRRWPFNL
jgi:HlyD family secretion protein